MTDDPKFSQDDVADAAEAFVGVGIAANFFRTIWDTLIWPNRVLAAAFANDQSRYLRPFRLFVILFGLQVAFTTMIGTPIIGDLDLLAPNATAEQIQAVFDAAAADPDVVADQLRLWIDLSLWPLTLLTFVPYLILFKLYRPARSVYGSFLANVVAINASYVVLLPLFPLIFIDPMVFMMGFTLGFVWYFVALGELCPATMPTHFGGSSPRCFGSCSLRHRSLF